MGRRCRGVEGELRIPLEWEFKVSNHLVELLIVGSFDLFCHSERELLRGLDEVIEERAEDGID